MKLSEAGLFGGMATGQCKSHLVTNTQTCFLGGALVAIGEAELGTIVTDHYRYEEKLYYILNKQWPFLNQQAINPVTSCKSRIMNIIWYLNDTENWTRPQIAAWIATIEPEEGGIADNINLSSEQTLTPGLTSLGVSCQG